MKWLIKTRLNRIKAGGMQVSLIDDLYNYNANKRRVIKLDKKKSLKCN